LESFLGVEICWILSMEGTKRGQKRVKKKETSKGEFMPRGQLSYHMERPFDGQ